MGKTDREIIWGGGLGEGGERKEKECQRESVGKRMQRKKKDWWRSDLERLVEK